MANRRHFLTNVNDPTTRKLTGNGTFYTEVQSADYDLCSMYIAAYDANDNVVVPSVGIATFSIETIKGQYTSKNFEGDNPVDLALIGEDSNYNIPKFDGVCIGAKVVISGADFVTDGIDHIKAFCWRV